MVAGASGFLGRAVVNVLVARGQDVLAVSRKPAAVAAGIRKQQVEAYRDLVPPPGAVLIHLAEPNVMSSVESACDAHEKQVRGELEALLARKWEHVVYASSAAVYGDQATHPRDVGETLAPGTVYARAKLKCEDDVIAAGGSVARLSNLYGPGLAKESLIAEMLAQIPGKGALQVRAVEPVRDYLWVEDGARGVADLAMQRVPGTFNFGSGRGVSVGDLGKMLLACAGEDRAISAAAPARRPSTLVLDVSRTKVKLGWSPQVPLESGLKRMLENSR